MSSPSFAQKLTAEAIGTAILVFIGAGSVPADRVPDRRSRRVRHRRDRGPVDDLVRVRVRDHGRGLLGRPHQWLPHQPGRDDLAAATRHIDGRTAGGYIVAQLVGAFIGAGLTLIILTGNDPATLGLGAVSVNDEVGPRHRLRGRGHRHRHPRLHGLSAPPCRARRRPGSPGSSSGSSSTGSSSSSARSPGPP